MNQDKKVWRLWCGEVVSTQALKRMFFGKLPGPSQRRLLGIEKVLDKSTT